MFLVVAMDLASVSFKAPMASVTFPQDKPWPWAIFWVFMLIFLAVLAVLLLFNLAEGMAQSRHIKKILVFIVVSLVIASISGVIAAACFKANKIDKQRDDLLKLDRELENDQEIAPDPNMEKQLEKLRKINEKANEFGTELRYLNMQNPVGNTTINKKLIQLEPISEIIDENRKLARKLQQIIDSKNKQLEQIKQNQQEQEQNLDNINNWDTKLTEKNEDLKKYLDKNIKQHLVFEPIIQRGNSIFFGGFSYDFKKKTLGYVSLDVPRPSFIDIAQENINIYNAIIVGQAWNFNNNHLIPLLTPNEESGLFEYDQPEFRFISMDKFNILYLKSQKTTIIKTLNQIIILSPEGVVIINLEEKNLQMYRFLHPELVFEYDSGGEKRNFERIPENNEILRSFPHEHFIYKDLRAQSDLQNEKYAGNIVLEAEGKVLVLDQEADK
jgi:Tfp pilus assembly protein PilN